MYNTQQTTQNLGSLENQQPAFQQIHGIYGLNEYIQNPANNLGYTDAEEAQIKAIEAKQSGCMNIPAFIPPTLSVANVGLLFWLHYGNLKWGWWKSIGTSFAVGIGLGMIQNQISCRAKAEEQFFFDNFNK